MTTPLEQDIRRRLSAYLLGAVTLPTFGRDFGLQPFPSLVRIMLIWRPWLEKSRCCFPSSMPGIGPSRNFANRCSVS